jgi:hypothetical protein
MPIVATASGMIIAPPTPESAPRLIERNETVAEPVDDGPGNEPDTASENDVLVTVHGTKSATKTNVPCVSLENEERRQPDYQAIQYLSSDLRMRCGNPVRLSRSRSHI